MKNIYYYALNKTILLCILSLMEQNSRNIQFDPFLLLRGINWDKLGILKTHKLLYKNIFNLLKLNFTAFFYS